MREVDDLVKADHCELILTAIPGQVTLKTPKLKGIRFATAIIERSKRRETSAEEAMIEDVSELLGGESASEAIASNLNDKAALPEAMRGIPGCRLPEVHRALMPQRALEAPKSKRRQEAEALEAIHAQESFDANMEKAGTVASGLDATKLKEDVRCVRDGVAKTLAQTRFPIERRSRIRTNNAIERLNREARCRPRMLALSRTARVRSSQWLSG